MSQYHCPECGSNSNVIDTRPSHNRLRRRRTCQGHQHRFSTIEVPLDTPKKIQDLIRFAVENSHAEDDEQTKQDMLDYALAASKELILGIPLEEQEAFSE